METACLLLLALAILLVQTTSHWVQCMAVKCKSETTRAGLRGKGGSGCDPRSVTQRKDIFLCHTQSILPEGFSDGNKMIGRGWVSGSGNLYNVLLSYENQTKQTMCEWEHRQARGLAAWLHSTLHIP